MTRRDRVGQNIGRIYVLGKRAWEPREPSRKGNIYTAMGHPRLQGTTCRGRTLVASRRQTLKSRMRTSGVPSGYPKHDSRKKRKATLPRRDKRTVHMETG